ncbi:Rad2 nuclease [Mortierella sp. GBA30]|nr:Rad2 nuclease [Mortierella sp. GBA30]
MGIQGLLPLLKSIEKPVHLKDYTGQTLAVDGYVWLHKGAFACAQELCLGQATQKYVAYFMRKIEMFKFFGVKPYVVFDGGYLPSKAITEHDRLGRREESRKQAMELLRAGKSKQALEQFRKCVDVTPEMAFAVIQALEAAQVAFVVAPYEADAQLAYLEKKGLVSGIVTEDSDLLVFGCKRVIFKLDQYGAGIEILNDNLSLVQDVSFHEWTMTEIRHMCILSGCDYLPSIPGMGLKTAQRLIRRFKTIDRAVKHLRMESTSMKIQSDYEAAFHRADLTFLYARVYDPNSKSMAHLNPVPEELEELVQTEEYDFLGPVIEQGILQGIATGQLHPMTKNALGAPPTSDPAAKGSPFYLGKENKPVVAVPSRTAMPSTKSIQSYFVRPATAPVTAPCASGIRAKQSLKRKPLTETASNATEVTMLEGISEAQSSVVQTDKSNTKDNATTACQQCPSTLERVSSDVIVEARSRFFGFSDPACENDRPSTLEKRSKAIREDSGIDVDDKTPCYSSESGSLSVSDYDAPFAESQESLPSTTMDPLDCTSDLKIGSSTSSESKTSEAKVIQGWREKFSNPYGPAVSVTTGLTRAFQSIQRSKSTHSLADTSMPRVRSSKAIGSYARKGIIKTAPGHPVYHLDTSRQKVTTTPINSTISTTVSKDTQRESSQAPMQTSLSDDPSENKPQDATLMLNLNRFKYTPPSLTAPSPLDKTRL